MGDAALIRAHYAVLRARYSHVTTQLHLDRYQCMVWNWFDPVPRQFPLAIYPHTSERVYESPITFRFC